MATVRQPASEGAVDGGHFVGDGRRAALNAALPLVVTYFAEAETWELEVSAQLGTQEHNDEQELDDFIAATRLRASLAAARRLLTILAALTSRPTFRYTQVNAESVGAIRGKLDLARYSRQQGRIEVPRRYPVRLVQRATATPENVLAAYAALWIRRELQATPTRLLPSKSPEHRDLHNLQGSLKRMLELPLLAGTAKAAHEVWRRGSLGGLLGQVSRRLEAGHIAQAEPYRELVDWITRTRSGEPVAEIGERDWSFYDERFDTKLFELWCLVQLADALTAQLGAPAKPVRSLTERGRGPMYVWNIGAGTLQLHFQANLATLADGNLQWRHQSGRALGGFPDLAVSIKTVNGRRLALLDPKLRQRRGMPTEELYKLLGYFANLGDDYPPYGAILYYSPGSFTDYTLTRSRDGEVHAVGLDPEATAGTDQFVSTADMLLSVAGLSERALTLLRAAADNSTGSAEERSVALSQELAVEVMQRSVEALPPQSLAPTRKQTAATLRSSWNKLSDQTQAMVVTAEYFANRAPDDADHSGPLLGLAAAVERILREAIFDPAAANSRDARRNNRQTLGSCLHILGEALSNGSDPAAEAVRRVLRSQREIDQAALRRLVKPTKAMNHDFRIPAAHVDVVTADTWARGHDAILHPSHGILPQLVTALGLRAQTTGASPTEVQPFDRGHAQV